MNDQNTTSIYEMLGGEEKIRLLTQRFYFHMEHLPQTQEIRKMHPSNISSSEEKLFMFLSGWLGGPQLFQEKYGHPRLRPDTYLLK